MVGVCFAVVQTQAKVVLCCGLSLPEHDVLCAWVVVIVCTCLGQPITPLIEGVELIFGVVLGSALHGVENDKHILVKQ